MSGFRFTERLVYLVCVSATICGAFVLCHVLTQYVLSPVQHVLFGAMDAPAPLVYLPHGVCVLATMLFGWKTLPLLFTGYAFAHYTLASESAVGPGSLEWMIPAMIVTLCSFVAFEGFRFFGKNYYATGWSDTHWRDIVGVGVVAAVIAAVGTTVLRHPETYGPSDITLISLHAFSSIAGMLVMFFGLMLLFRWHRLLFLRPAP